MKYVFDKNAHSVYSLNYHFVQCIKYRRKIFDFPEIIDELKLRTKNIAESYGIEILSIETDLDHVHILFKSKPFFILFHLFKNKYCTYKTIITIFFFRIKTKLICFK